MKVPITLLLFALAALLHAQTEIAPFVGWQSGGAVVVDFEEGSVESAPTYGAMISRRRSPSTWMDFVIAHQSSSAETGTFFEPRTSDTSVTYLHAGGRYVFNGRDRVNPYIAATLGATVLSADSESVLAFSYALGAGADIALARNIKLRFDGRYYTTLDDVSTQVSCEFNVSGECSLFAEGTNFGQLALTAGVAFAF